MLTISTNSSLLPGYMVQTVPTVDATVHWQPVNQVSHSFCVTKPKTCTDYSMDKICGSKTHEINPFKKLIQLLCVLLFSSSVAGKLIPPTVLLLFCKSSVFFFCWKWLSDYKKERSQPFFHCYLKKQSARLHDIRESQFIVLVWLKPDF